MQETVTNSELANLDLSKVAALQQKRTLAFVNHFMITTVQFLNNFMKKCEQKLMTFERKLEKVEATMVLLEARLSSIPEVNTAQSDIKGTTATETVSPSAESNGNSASKQETTGVAENPSSAINTTEEEKTTSAQEETFPEYNRFVKMVQVGVPLQAVKLKASLEGLDPNILVKVLGK